MIDLIDECMANNWKGIIWEKIEKKSNSEKQNDILRGIYEGQIKIN